MGPASRRCLAVALAAMLGACTAAKPNFAPDAGRDAAVVDAGPRDAGDTTDAGGTDAGGSCGPDTGDCDGEAGNGCEADLRSDDAHCGACDAPCTGGRSCVGGACLSVTIVDVALGGEHSCAVLSTGHILCWGRDEMGQLGDCVPGSGDRPEAMPVMDPMGGPVTDAVGIAAAFNTTCALRGVDGRIDCWGGNNPNRFGPVSGALGAYGCPEPQLFSGSPAAGAGLALAGSHTCVLAGGSAQCAGSNASDQLGRAITGSTTTLLAPIEGLPAGAPVQVAPGGGFTGGFTLVLMPDGAVYCLGYNAEAECALSGGGSIDTPTSIGALSNVVQVAAGIGFACALDDAGIVWCWGRNDSGQAGTGMATTAEVVTPAPVEGPSLPPFESIVAGGDFVLAVAEGGHEVWGWGRNEGQFGLGPSMLADLEAPTRLLTEPSATFEAYAGSSHACLVRRVTAERDELRCAGRNLRGQLGQPPIGAQTTFEPVPGVP